jgi:hypothetical protein
MARLVQLALLNRLPRRSRRSRWRRLAKSLARPQTVLWVAPALLLPFLAMALISEDAGPSPIEQTVAALPIPVDQSNPADAAAAGSPFGTGAAPPASVTMPIYNQSALALTTQMQTINANRWDQPDQPVAMLDQMDYAELHPAARAQDDLLAGEVNGLLTMPLSADISFKIFQAYCGAQPGDPFYSVDIKSLPIDRDLLASLQELAQLAPNSGLCPRLSGKG